MQPKSPPNPGRRKFLIGATSAVGAVGIAGAAVPFISAFNQVLLQKQQVLQL